MQLVNDLLRVTTKENNLLCLLELTNQLFRMVDDNASLSESLLLLDYSLVIPYLNHRNIKLKSKCFQVYESLSAQDGPLVTAQLDLSLLDRLSDEMHH